jgi:regulatory protein
METLRDGETPEIEREQRVTAIERQKRNPERVNVYLNGVFAFGLPVMAVAEQQLRIGLILPPDQIAALKELDETAKAVDSAIRLLTSRPRSVREIRDRLRQKSYDDETIDRVIAKLRDWRYIDDDAFARYWVENREANRPRGRRLLEQELRQKGIDRETVAEAIEDAEIDEHAGALEIARSKLRSYQDLEPAVAKRRLGGFLARRGYGYPTIKPVLDQLFGESDDDQFGE